MPQRLTTLEQSYEQFYGSDDSTEAARPAVEDAVRGSFVVDLLIRDSSDQRPVAIVGTRIVGPVDLRSCSVSRGLVLQDCLIEQPLALDGATLPFLLLRSCRLNGMEGSHLKARRDVTLSGCDFAPGSTLRLLNATIEGGLKVHDTRFDAIGLPVVFADQLSTGGSVSFTEVSTTGELRMLNAQIGGQLNALNCTIDNPADDALSFDGSTFGRSLRISGLTATGAVRLSGAKIEGQLELTGLTVRSSPIAIFAPRATVAGDVSIRQTSIEGVTDLRSLSCRGSVGIEESTLSAPGRQSLSMLSSEITGSVRVVSSRFAGGIGVQNVRVAGQMVFDKCEAESASVPAVNTDSAIVGSNLLINNCQIKGAVDMTSSDVSGEVHVSDSRIGSPGAQCVLLDTSTFGRGVQFLDTTLSGTVRAMDTRIEGNLHFERTTIGGSPLSLVTQQMRIGGSIVMDLDSAFAGTVNLFASKTGGHLILGSRFEGQPEALVLEAAQARRALLGFADPPRGLVDLTDANLATLEDHPAVWARRYKLEGLRYQRVLSVGPVSLRRRLEFLQRDVDDYQPEKYDILAAAFARAGMEDEARRVRIDKRRQGTRRRALHRRFVGLVLDATVGYGYRPLLAGLWVAAFLVFGAYLFGTIFDGQFHRLSSTNKGPDFSPWAYTLDLLLPVITLNQKATWVPEGGAATWSWVFVIAGWVLTSAVVAALAGIVRRES